MRFALLIFATLGFCVGGLALLSNTMLVIAHDAKYGINNRLQVVWGITSFYLCLIVGFSAGYLAIVEKISSMYGCALLAFIFGLLFLALARRANRSAWTTRSMFDLKGIFRDWKLIN